MIRNIEHQSMTLNPMISWQIIGTIHRSVLEKSIHPSKVEYTQKTRKEMDKFAERWIGMSNIRFFGIS